MTEHQAFHAAILSSPGDDGLRQMYADWLDEYGWGVKAGEAWEPPVLSSLLPRSYYGGIGIGSGSGSGIGRGSGIVSGSGIGRGSGSGSGSGIGRGSGSGSGIGSGIGRGIVSGSGRGRKTIVEIGRAYLIETVDWFAWVGRVKRQVGPWEYEFVSCSKVAETNNGDVWHDMAAGDEDARRRATYKHYKTPVILGLGVVAKILWEGQTPQEAGL